MWSAARHRAESTFCEHCSLLSAASDAQPSSTAASTTVHTVIKDAASAGMQSFW
jgi:hypothetical protein